MINEQPMELIENMLTGQVEMPRFIVAFQSDENLQNALRSLLPADAINNPQHDLWTRISYSSFRQNDFDFVRFITWICRLDCSMDDNLNLFCFVKTMYMYNYPFTECTSYYRDIHGLYLDAVRDCYDGPEVKMLVQESLKVALTEPTKSKRTKRAKETILKLFHVDSQKRPRWIHGPEWPMGQHSPMKFISQKSKGECVIYHFVDVDTNEEKVITEFY